jgi:hypothetical protein
MITVVTAFLFPFDIIYRWMNYLVIGFSYQPGYILRAAGYTKSAADTPVAINRANAFDFADRLDLTAIHAFAAVGAEIGIDDRVVVGIRYRVGDSPLGNPTQDRTATAAAIADIG